MKKFLLVGVGGSGGMTLRFVMDQLSADLRARGVDELPPAWQFVHVDVPPEPERGPGQLRSVRDMGGRYISVSSPGNTYALVASRLLQGAGNRGSLRSLLGWMPDPAGASGVPVVDGAGQYRAVGRSLFLSDLQDVLTGLRGAWEDLQQPTSWGTLPGRVAGTYAADAAVIPVVVGSMAGGSGAAMFLDVCRLLGRINGLPRSNIGAFLFTADVFKALPPGARSGVDGNALAALAELVCAQTRASDAADDELFSALGLPPEVSQEPAFARLIPIGSSIGGDGAQFGDGTAAGVARGLGRALAATMLSEQASGNYVKSKIENPASTEADRSAFGWSTPSRDIAWGSFGYASLSLGRDRYAEYAAQRVARVAFDRLLRGHRDQLSALPDIEQISLRLEAQWPTTLGRLGYPQSAADVRGWFTEWAFPRESVALEARKVLGPVVELLAREAPANAPDWLAGVRLRLPHLQPMAREMVREAAYLWASGWTLQLETAIKEEFTLATGQVGLPYARRLVQRLREHLQGVVEALRTAAEGGIGDPLVLDEKTTAQAAAAKKTVVDVNHTVGAQVMESFHSSASKSLRRETARLAAEVLSSFCEHVLPALDRAASDSILTLQQAELAAGGEAGLAQLATTAYAEWPLDSDAVPSRFDHADNEVLLTTSAQFPAHFVADVSASVSPPGGPYDGARDVLVTEVLLGRWETSDGTPLPAPVLGNRSGWRPAVLPVDALTKAPTQMAQPTYRLEMSPKDVLGRARQHLGRRGQPFHRFSGQSIADFLTDEREPEAVLHDRAVLFAEKFAETLKLARPLVGVSPQMVQVVHPGETLRYEFTFSDIPLPGTSSAVVAVREQLRADRELDGTTLTAFDQAVAPTSQENKIAVFGAYPRYSPLVYSSLLDQIQQRWASSPDLALPALWSWKRARPLTSALAMGEKEQKAMVAGWLLGRLLGLVDVPTAMNQEAGPVQVWAGDAGWLAFPRRLLTSPTLFRGPDDWLPAVLESHTLALVQCNNDTSLRALAPYRALRGLYDDNGQDALVDYQTPRAVRLLKEWLGSGVWPSGRPSVVLTDPTLTGATPAERAAAATAWLGAVQEWFGQKYLTDGAGLGSFERRRARVTNADDVISAPLFAQVAELAYAVIDDLRAQVSLALTQTSQTGGGSDEVLRPNF